MRNTILAAAIGLPIAMASSGAFATNIQFDSTGTFSNPTNAVIANGGLSVDWPNNGYDHSYMAADDFSNHTANTPVNHILIGQIDWYNASQSDAATTVSFNYNLSIHFDLPAPGGTTNDSLALTVMNTANNARVCGFFGCSNTGNVDDTASGFTSTSLTVDGFTLSNIAFDVSSGGSFSGGTWSNPEGNISTLNIYADIRRNTPEPMSLALLGTGLAGLGLVRGRKGRA